MRVALIASTLVLATGVGVLWHATDEGRALTTETARRINVAETLPRVPDAALETMTGAHLQLHPGPGQITAVEFIYTTCPTICQSAGADFARLRDAAAAIAPQLRLISLSFDPETDDPEHLAIYGNWHGADGDIWTVARPSRADLPGLLDSFGVTVIPDGWGGYIHNTAIHLLDDRGRLAAIVDTDDIDGALAAARQILR
ncbi:SCO family protein [Roseovarius sp. M141]|uniref:SCO family protein n=1 Tax=Roseovarius sp. M141 TaxID=2583806 RepID=UPI0020CC4E39|nr:SCO family protein [Roseovarius sp. M141]MCQ0093134.1 SCO family protein [Roseovarius sp. M141]